ncbi:hypothetical protein EYF80_012671 [Liparis tanakae]|uniref:Uncharacterized protein n=1 Tax=Liparis tanakae TaxID=230148 RepID=A0A4Z2IIJ3_9TELE|nr:hypothetical protein EYF80_012671 [Liparis tanakae]
MRSLETSTIHQADGGREEEWAESQQYKIHQHSVAIKKINSDDITSEGSTLPLARQLEGLTVCSSSVILMEGFLRLLRTTGVWTADGCRLVPVSYSRLLQQQVKLFLPPTLRWATTDRLVPSEAELSGGLVGVLYSQSALLVSVTGIGGNLSGTGAEGGSRSPEAAPDPKPCGPHADTDPSTVVTKQSEDGGTKEMETCLMKDEHVTGLAAPRLGQRLNNHWSYFGEE